MPGLCLVSFFLFNFTVQVYTGVVSPLHVHVFFIALWTLCNTDVFFITDLFSYFFPSFSQNTWFLAKTKTREKERV